MTKKSIKNYSLLARMMDDPCTFLHANVIDSSNPNEWFEENWYIHVFYMYFDIDAFENLYDCWSSVWFFIRFDRGWTNSSDSWLQNEKYYVEFGFNDTKQQLID